jgi:hypothetical protein
VVAAKFRKSSISIAPSLRLLTKLQIPQTRLVTSGWLVLSTCELEGKYGSDGCSHIWDHGDDVEAQRRAGNADEIP